MDNQTQLEVEAATFRRLLAHLDAHKEVQNIDLMNLASFCRNCLSKWYRAEAEERGQGCSAIAQPIAGVDTDARAGAL